MPDPLIQFIKTVCTQTAVYWANPQPDGYGSYTWDTPVEIPCLWNEKRQVVTDTNGKEVVSNAEILVTQDIDTEGMLYLGSLSDISASLQDSPKEVNGAYPVINVARTPLFWAPNEHVTTVYL